MTYSFKEKLLEEGNRHFIKIPFNVWEESGQQGLIPVKVSIMGCTFECKLIPKGEGVYYIPITKNIINMVVANEDIVVCFEIISGLTRINHDSPYTKDNPIRKINSIKPITYPKTGYCGQICIAMLTGLSVDEIVNVMHSKSRQVSFSKIIETLDYFGIQYENKMVYTRGKESDLPDCCIINVDNHYMLYFKGKYYDSGSALTEFNKGKIVSYLKIIIK